MTVSTNTMDKQKTAPVIHERPKMPRATWEALRHHIIKQRKRKQDEEGKAEEYERLKRERENKKKQEANSLEETKEQIGKLEEKLTNLKEEKHQLFLTLKKVLNEDDSRRRKETNEMNILYPQHGAPNALAFPLTGHMAPNNPQLTAMYLQPQSARQLAYMKPHGIPPQMPPAQPIKRQRTPSPPRSSSYYRTVPITAPGRIAASSVYGHPSAPASGAPIYATSGLHFPGASVSQTREEERRQQVYLSHQQGARYVTSMHQAQLEAASAGARSTSDRDRGRLALAPAAHSQPVSLPSTRAGSITSGFPVQRPTGHLAAPYTTATLGHSLPPRLAYSQGAAAQLAVAQQQAAQAAQAGQPPTRYYGMPQHGREV